MSHKTAASSWARDFLTKIDQRPHFQHGNRQSIASLSTFVFRKMVLNRVETYARVQLYHEEEGP